MGTFYPFFLFIKKGASKMPTNLNNDITICKQIYMEFKEYQELRESDQAFFDSLFILLYLKDINQEFSNKYLSSRLGMPVSTVEKRLRRLERAHLIMRFIARFKNKDGYWTTGRTIKLDNITFAFLYTKNNVNFTPEEVALFKQRREEVDSEGASEKFKEELEKPAPKKRRVIRA